MKILRLSFSQVDENPYPTEILKQNGFDLDKPIEQSIDNIKKEYIITQKEK